MEQLPAGLHLREAVAAELVDQGGRDLQGNDVFEDHARGGHSADVAPFIGGRLRPLRFRFTDSSGWPACDRLIAAGPIGWRWSSLLQAAGVVRGPDGRATAPLSRLVILIGSWTTDGATGAESEPDLDPRIAWTAITAP